MKTKILILTLIIGLVLVSCTKRLPDVILDEEYNAYTPQNALAKYYELAVAYNSSFGTRLIACEIAKRNVFLVDSAVTESFIVRYYYEQNGSLIGNYSVTGDVVEINGPLSITDPTDYKECVLIKESNKITNFEKCRAAGYAVLESYPKQCISFGRFFVDPIGEVPERVLVRYNQLEEKYNNSIGAILYWCNKDEEIIYKVTGSGGFSGVDYFFDSDGWLIGTYEWDDMIEPNEPKPPVEVDLEQCTLVKESFKSVDQP